MGIGHLVRKHVTHRGNVIRGVESGLRHYANGYGNFWHYASNALKALRAGGSYQNANNVLKKIRSRNNLMKGKYRSHPFKHRLSNINTNINTIERQMNEAARAHNIKMRKHQFGYLKEFLTSVPHGWKGPEETHNKLRNRKRELLRRVNSYLNGNGNFSNGNKLKNEYGNLSKYFATYGSPYH